MACYEWLTYSVIQKLRMACYYYIVVYCKWMLTYSAICNIIMACYDTIDDSKWMVHLFGDLKPRNGLLLHCSLF